MGHACESSLGTKTRVNSRTPGREANRSRYGWGQTTPREMARLLVMIREEKAVSPAASQEMYRHLTRSYWTGEALSVLPPWVQVASKVGAVDRSRSLLVATACHLFFTFTEISSGRDRQLLVGALIPLVVLLVHFWPRTPAPGTADGPPVRSRAGTDA